jgi:D-inositol-3-phosphate glycosyltransferase
VITLSGGLRQWLVDRGVPAEKISIVGNAAPALDGAGRPDASAALAVRAKHRIPAEAKVIGYLGAIVAYEGLDALISAHARTPAAERPYLLIAGSGAQEPMLRKLVSRLGTVSRVVFAGRVTPDQVAAYYAASDAVVLPRRDDILTRLVPALKPFEVLGYGRPLFVSPVLAQALADTLPAGYDILDVDAVDRLDLLFESRPPLAVNVPTWNQRGAQLLSLYRALVGTSTV